MYALRKKEPEVVQWTASALLVPRSWCCIVQVDRLGRIYASSMNQVEGDSSSDKRKVSQALEQSLSTVWNARVASYDSVSYPFQEWMVNRIREAGYAIDRLDNLHDVVPAEETAALTKRLTDDTSRPEYRKLVQRFVQEVVVREGKLQGDIAMQRFHNVRINRPSQPDKIIDFHNGLWYGHGLGSRSLWMPLTDQTRPEDGSASLQVVDLERSRKLMRYANQNNLTNAQMQALFVPTGRSVVAGPGQFLMFTQENIHGNINNDTGKTRVSIDFRVVESIYAGEVARKWIGGYFELLDHAEMALALKQEALSGCSAPSPTDVVISYQNNNGEYMGGIPIYMQRYMVAEYAKKHGLKWSFEHIELEGMNQLPTLLHITEEIVPHTVIMYSIYALPRETVFRDRILDGVLRNDINVHFANEDIFISTEADRRRVDDILKFAKYS